jgi:hypothetical protein
MGEMYMIIAKTIHILTTTTTHLNLQDVLPRQIPFIQDKPRDSGERTNDYTRAPYLGLKPVYKTMNQGSAAKGQYRHQPR